MIYNLAVDWTRSSRALKPTKALNIVLKCAHVHVRPAAQTKNNQGHNQVEAKRRAKDSAASACQRRLITVNREGKDLQN